MAMNNIMSQDSWCVTLSKDKPEYSWPEGDAADDEVMHHLLLEQVSTVHVIMYNYYKI